MAANDEFSFIENNQQGYDLLPISHILPYLRTNKGGAHNYQCQM